MAGVVTMEDVIETLLGVEITDETDLEKIGAGFIDLVAVNLYPFEATVARPDVAKAEAIEKIDIGGPSLVRAAAKNHAFTTIATDPMQYSAILEQVSSNGATTADYDLVADAGNFVSEGTITY